MRNGSPTLRGCAQARSDLRTKDSGRGETMGPGQKILFFDRENGGFADHVDIVKCCENGVVLTIEGNSGDTCRENAYPVGSTVIYGYGVALY